MKKIISMVCTALMALSLFGATAAHADTSNAKVENGVKILGEYNGKQVVSVKKITNGNWVDVSFEEFLKDMNTKQQATVHQNPTKMKLQSPTSIMKPADAVYTWYDYWESSGYYYNASPRKTSPDYGCPSSAPAPCTLSLQYSLTQSKSANVSLSLPEWNAIKATLGYTYQDQASVAATYALPVPPGKYGHMEFAPKYYHSEGTMEAWMSSISGVQLVGTQYVGCETPQKLQTGFLDGYAIGVITNSPT